MNNEARDEIRATPIWELYEKGRNYHMRKGTYVDTDRNYRMYNGNQWEGAKLGGVEPVQKNFIKPIVKYKCSVIHDNLYAIVYTSLNYEDKAFRKTAERICEMLNGYAERVWEKDKMDFKGRKITKDAAINDEGIIYVNWDVNSNMPINEIVKKNDIYYGNENDDDIQAQPYILIRKRLPLVNAIEFAREAEISEDLFPLIIPDNDTFTLSGESAKDELDDMVTFVYKFYKENNTTHFSVATRLVTIIEDADIGISHYPFAHFNWEEKEGSARGEGEVKNLIPNQIEVNKTEMRRVITCAEQAYPMKVIDVTRISNPEAINNVGATLEVNGHTVDDVRKIVGTIPPAQMSPDVAKHQEDLISMSRDLAGAGDSATGDIDPESASGRAILAVQTAQRAPLTEQKEGFKNFVEDIARIWLDYIIAYSADGINLEEKVIDKNGNESIAIVNVPQSALKQLQATVKIDITPKSAFDKYAQELSLENLLQGGFFGQRMPELKIYVKLLPDDSVMPKAKLERAIDEYDKQQREIAMMQQEANLMNQRAQMYVSEDIDAQAQQLADVERVMLLQKAAAQGQMVNENAEVVASEKALDDNQNINV